MPNPLSTSTSSAPAPAYSRREALRSLVALTSGAAFLPSFFASAARAADAPPAKATTEPTGNPNIDKNLAAFEFSPLVTAKLTPTLAMLSGPGGNMAVLTAPDGALLVDSGVHPTAPAVARGAAAFAGHPVTTLVNTHWHFDHSGGNEFFGQHGCRIVAHDNTRVRMSRPQTIEAFNFTFPASPGAALPVLTFPDNATLHFGDEAVGLQHVAPAHTDGDILVHFTKADVLQTGDTFFNGFYPFIDYSSGGWIGGMVLAADAALKLCGEQTRLIPGHGPLAKPADLKAARDMLATIQGRLEKLLDAGKSVDEIVAAAPTKDFDAQWGKGFFNGEAFTRNAVAGLMRHRQA